MSILAQIFTWWNGPTIGTRFFTWRRGQRVGEDASGNVFYQSRNGAGRRWVIYAGDNDASRVQPEWHGWLHHTWQDPPTTAPLPRKLWERPHRPNLTGSTLAYHPPGSLHAESRAVPRDYEAWTPE